VNDVIKLEFPAKPDYILAVRLAVSAIAERAGFDIEDIEDLKVATAEACMLLLGSHPDTIKVKIKLDKGMHIDLEALGENTGAAAKDETAELSRYLLEALVDECAFLPENDAESDLQDGIRGIRFYKSCR
jgi:serine/threonine-protein kinase RsbW